MRADRAQKFYRLHAPIYDVTRKMFLFRRRRALDLLDIQPGQVVADFGCGTGLNFPEILKKDVHQVIGIDASTDMLRRAQGKSPRVRLIQGDLEEFRLIPEVDRVLCTYALSLVENWEAALENMATSLKADGVLVILDFFPLRSFLKPVEPIFHRWLRGFGVNHRQNTGAVLRRMFSEVYEEYPTAGYCSIHVGRNPRIKKKAGAF